jgi:uncharacterized protein
MFIRFGAFSWKRLLCFTRSVEACSVAKVLSKWVHPLKSAGVTALVHAISQDVVYGKDSSFQGVHFDDGQIDDNCRPDLQQILERAHFLVDEGNDLPRPKPHPNEGLTLLRYLMTNICNLDCPYCQIQENKPKCVEVKVIDSEKVVEGLEVFVRNAHAVLPKTVEISGGEPLAYPHVVQEIVEKIRGNPETEKYRVVLSTNATLMTDEMAQFLSAHDVLVLVSLDGWEELHNVNRPFRGSKRGSYQDVVRGYRILQKKEAALGLSLVANSLNLPHLPEIAAFMADTFSPQSIGMNYLKFPSMTDPSFERIDMREYADKLYAAFQVCRDRGIFLEQAMRRVEPFVEQKIRMYDCSAQGRALNVSPEGWIGPCKTLIHHPDFRSSLPSADLPACFSEYGARSQLNWDSCDACEGIAICGGGCGYDAFVLHGNIQSVDPAECGYVTRFMEHLVWDLFALAGKQKSGDFFIPSENDRRLLMGNTKSDYRTMRSSIGHKLE